MLLRKRKGKATASLLEAQRAWGITQDRIRAQMRPEAKLKPRTSLVGIASPSYPDSFLIPPRRVLTLQPAHAVLSRRTKKKATTTRRTTRREKGQRPLPKTKAYLERPAPYPAASRGAKKPLTAKPDVFTLALAALEIRLGVTN